MIAASLGLTDAPNPATAEDQIDRVRDLALGYDSSESQGTNEGQMANAISAMGGSSEYLNMSLPQVEQLQNTLVSLGYMTQEEMDTGPGIFGPRTQAALGRFQQDHGIDYDGSAYGPQSRAALTQVQAQASGAPASPAAADPAAPAGASAPTAAPAPAGGSPYNTQTGVDYGYSDCGPTSTLMIAASLGLTDAPNPATAENQIDRVRDLALGYDSSESQGTNEGQMANAISAMGGTSEYLDMSLSQVDQALASGQRVLIAGNPWGAWGADMDANGQYLNHQNPGAHFVAILGKTPDGQYLVADPLSAVGVIAVSGEQIQAFWNEGGGNSGAMAVGR
jgi:peptidoglycan hydrolase-like protein with peptidoglycan-binding domain